MKFSLDGVWKLTYFPSRGASEGPAHPAQMPRVDAQVPGNVELDLERAGVLPELFRGDNIPFLHVPEINNYSCPVKAIQGHFVNGHPTE